FFLLARHLRCPKVLQRLRKVPKKRLLPRQRKLSTHGSMRKIDELSARRSCADEVIEYGRLFAAEKALPEKSDAIAAPLSISIRGPRPSWPVGRGRPRWCARSSWRHQTLACGCRS